MTTLIIVRHGFSLSNKDNTFTGQLDIPLSEVGYKQAELCSDYILNTYKVDAIYSSDLSRAQDTIKKVSEKTGLPVQTEKALREIYGGEWEGMTSTAIYEQYPEMQDKWAHDIGRCRCPDGESLEETGARAYAKLLEIAKKEKGKTVVVATHAGVIRSVECIIRGYGADRMKEVEWVSNASVTELFFDGEKFTEGKIGYDEYLSGIKTELKAF